MGMYFDPTSQLIMFLKVIKLNVDLSSHLLLPPPPPPQEQSLLQPPTLQLLNGMGPLGRRASDGGANIQLPAQLLKRPRGPLAASHQPGECSPVSADLHTWTTLHS